MNPRPAGPPTLRRHNLGLVLAALRAAGGASRAELAEPTLAAGETYADLLADRSAFEEFDPEEAAERGLGAVRLTQLAVEHLMGAR